ncbi:diguanylate cyclase [Luteibacter aegosomaticola]|uniref:sensor domain-containing diguanylate cyclase n=1 Tax=Luteibacter aegosomaticola TaxID=2911538 RepID=UPI001FF7FA39|nr:diguanylate cyclase [Luteibacter aegosomaticola]UPG90244.1 diguanylate cyclase [Luteibacter aegosomaticola]
MPQSEVERLERLHNLAVLDTGAEDFFDALVHAAAEVTGMPISLISLIDRDRQWFKANFGLTGVTQTPRELAFCDHVVRGGATVEVPDAQLDPRFAENPLVLGDPNIRAYTGVPLTLTDGTHLGSLCVIDREPRALRPDQLRVLGHLAAAASMALEQRGDLIHQREVARAEAKRARRLERELDEKQQFLQRTGRVAGVGGWEFDLKTRNLRWSDYTCHIHDLPAGFEPTLDEALSFFAPDVQAQLGEAMDRAQRMDIPWDMTIPMVTATGRHVWVRAVGGVEREQGEAVRLAGAVQDVTERKMATAAVEASERRYRKLFQYSLGLICTHDLQGEVLSVNPAAAASLGYDMGDMLGVNLREFMLPERRSQLERYLHRIQAERIAMGVMELVASDGSLRYWRYQNVLDEDADEPYILGHAQDVTEQRRYENTLVEWSTRDPLTHAMNRRYLAQLEARSEHDGPWGCIVVDLDHFKTINDTYGHARGDEILVGVAQQLRDASGPDDVVVRMGGDEFLVVVNKAGDVSRVLDTLQHALRTSAWSLSLGAAVYAPGETVDQVIARADDQLYAHRAVARHAAR